MTRLGLGILTALTVWAFAGDSSLASAPEAGTTDDSKAVAASTNDFGIALYGSLAEDNEDGNLFFSPFSISTALAMTYAGARGDTADELKSALRLDIDSTQTHPAYKKLIDGLNARSAKDGVTLSVANALWGQEGYEFQKDFVTLARDNYGAGLETVDFAKSEAARKMINDWVAAQTKDKIQDLIPAGTLDKSTRLVLTNAVYFKGNWAHQFKASATREGPFTLADGSKVRPQMMHQTGRFRYAEWPDLQALDMPYKGGELSMTILLPKEVDGLALLEATLTPEALDETLAALKTEEVAVAVPKVKFTQSFSLVEALRYMGMEGAFTEDADFSGMTGRKGLYISAVLHKTFVAIDEKGTEAAAATAVMMALAAAPIREEPKRFTADHPFIFLIRDTKTGVILFMGRVADPTK